MSGIAAWKLVRTLVTRPEARRDVEGDPEPTRREEIETALLDQAWHALESFQIEVRTGLDGSPFRSLLDDDGLAGVEFDRESLRPRLAPIVQDLDGFASAARKRYLERRAPGDGLGDRMRRALIDRTLALLGVLLTVLVIPAILHETLARMGMKDFVNEIERATREARVRCRTLIGELVEEQAARYRERLEAGGPSIEDLDRLDTALSEETAP